MFGADNPDVTTAGAHRHRSRVPRFRNPLAATSLVAVAGLVVTSQAVLAPPGSAGVRATPGHHRASAAAVAPPPGSTWIEGVITDQADHGQDNVNVEAWPRGPGATSPAASSLSYGASPAHPGLQHGFFLLQVPSDHAYRIVFSAVVGREDGDGFRMKTDGDDGRSSSVTCGAVPDGSRPRNGRAGPPRPCGIEDQGGPGAGQDPGRQEGDAACQGHQPVRHERHRQGRGLCRRQEGHAPADGPPPRQVVVQAAACEEAWHLQGHRVVRRQPHRPSIQGEAGQTLRPQALRVVLGAAGGPATAAARPPGRCARQPGTRRRRRSPGTSVRGESLGVAAARLRVDLSIRFGPRPSRRRRRR